MLPIPTDETLARGLLLLLTRRARFTPGLARCNVSLDGGKSWLDMRDLRMRTGYVLRELDARPLDNLRRALEREADRAGACDSVRDYVSWALARMNDYTSVSA